MLSRLNFFNRLNARARIFVLVAVVLVVGVVIYLATRWLSGDAQTTGPSRVATAPPGLQTIPGAPQQSPEFQRSLEQASTTRATQATMTGTSAVPTLISYGGTTGTCMPCTDASANVKNYLDTWSTQGQIAPDVAAELQALADKNVTEAEYAAKLAELVRQNKLTPEQARLLLDEYRKQHAHKLQQDSAKLMDQLIQSGQLPLDAANELLQAQKNKVSPAEYAALLQRLVREGKISPETAQRLLAQYTQQRAKEIVSQSIATLQEMSRTGQITQEVLKDLIQLETNMVPVDAFTVVLAKYVKAGKLTPAVSAKILDEYNEQKAAIGPTQSLARMIQQAEAAAYGEINDLLKQGKMTQEVAAELSRMIQTNASLDDFRKLLVTLVQQKKISPEIAKLKFADYQTVKKLRDLSERLTKLQANNASAADYAAALKQAVQDGALTPEQAAQLMQEYQAVLARTPTAAVPTAAGTAEFAQLQQRVLEGAPPAAGAPATAGEFAVAEAQAVQETDQQRQARLQALTAAMSAQAGQLVGAWQAAPQLLHREGAPPTPPAGKGTEKGGAGAATTTTTTTTTTEQGPVIIKAGTVLFGVLDTAANSDYPNNPVMVTIVEGPYKGGKLLGKLQTEKNVAGQLDRITLNFTLMNYDTWPTSKAITAYAIDPDTARAALATSVDKHTLDRYGGIILTSLLQGYSNAIQSSSSTSTTGIFGTSSTHPELSPSNKLAVAFGQIGQNLAATTQAWVNIPPTVRIEAGVGLGLLFTADVT